MAIDIGNRTYRRSLYRDIGADYWLTGHRVNYGTSNPTSLLSRLDNRQNPGCMSFIHHNPLIVHGKSCILLFQGIGQDVFYRLIGYIKRKTLA